MIVIYHHQFFSDCFTRIFYSKMSFGLLFSDSGRDNAFKLAPWVSALGSDVDVNIYTYHLTTGTETKASLTMSCGLGGAKASARIGEGLKILNTIGLMHIPGTYNGARGDFTSCFPGYFYYGTTFEQASPKLRHFFTSSALL